MEVIYSINNKYFADYGVYVSKSEGVMDMLKRKEPNTYNWYEYHGIQVDLDTPRYMPREITLHCFITGNNWQDLFNKFLSMITEEFSKAGTQRLLIEPIPYKGLPFEVYMEDEVKVSKTFKNGEMTATFIMKLIEPNPIKKVLYTTKDTLNLNYMAHTETEVSYGLDIYGNNSKRAFPGSVNINNTTLPDRRAYDYKGRNLISGTKDFTGSWVFSNYWATLPEKFKDFTVKRRANGSWARLHKEIYVNEGEIYTYSCYCRKSNVYAYLFSDTVVQAEIYNAIKC